MNARQIGLCLALLIVVIVFLVLSSSSPSPLPPNPAVNEHSFVNIGPGMSETEVTAILGTPHTRTHGERVQVLRPNTTKIAFAIDETPHAAGDVLCVFDGLYGERIRVLFSQSEHRVVAAEYCLDEVAIYYIGDKKPNCRTRDAIAAMGSKDWNEITDQTTLARKETLLTFFGSRFTSPVQEPPPSTQEPLPFFAAPPPVETSPDPAAHAQPSTPSTKPSTPWTKPSVADSTSEPKEFEKLTLPSGTELHRLMLEIPADWNTALFPQNAVVYVNKYPNGNIQGVYNLTDGKLDGPSASLYENGHLKVLTAYRSGQLDGALNLWKEDGDRLYYGQYVNGRKNGLTCYFDDARPVLVQEYATEKLVGEHLITEGSDDFVVKTRADLTADEEAAFGVAYKALSDLEAQIDEQENALKRGLSEWYRREDKRLRQQRAARASSAKRAAIQARALALRAQEAAKFEAMWRAAVQRAWLFPIRSCRGCRCRSCL